MTDWECGQDLCAISDFICEKMGANKSEMKRSHPDVYWMLDDLARTIGDKFNREPFVTSHGFGLVSHNECGAGPTPSEKGEKDE